MRKAYIMIVGSIGLLTAPCFGQGSIIGEGPIAHEYAECVATELQRQGLQGTGVENIENIEPEIFLTARQNCNFDEAVRATARSLQSQDQNMSTEDATTSAYLQLGVITSMYVLLVFKAETDQNAGPRTFEVPTPPAPAPPRQQRDNNAPNP